MKLQEQFWEIIKKQQTDRPTECVKIANKFAVDFFNWAKSYQSNDRNNWGLSTKELLEIYKEL